MKGIDGSGMGFGNANIDVQGLQVAEFGDPSHEAEDGEAGVVASDRELSEGGELLEILHGLDTEVPSGDRKVEGQLLNRGGVEGI